MPGLPLLPSEVTTTPPPHSQPRLRQREPLCGSRIAWLPAPRPHLPPIRHPRRRLLSHHEDVLRVGVERIADAQNHVFLRAASERHLSAPARLRRSADVRSVTRRARNRHSFSLRLNTDPRHRVRGAVVPLPLQSLRSRPDVCVWSVADA